MDPYTTWHVVIHCSERKTCISHCVKLFNYYSLVVRPQPIIAVVHTHNERMRLLYIMYCTPGVCLQWLLFECCVRLSHTVHKLVGYRFRLGWVPGWPPVCSQVTYRICNTVRSNLQGFRQSNTRLFWGIYYVLNVLRLRCKSWHQMCCCNDRGTNINKTQPINQTNTCTLKNCRYPMHTSWHK
jgi:hypothetical protein